MFKFSCSGLVGGWVMDSVGLMRDEAETTSHSYESPVATTYRPAWILAAIYQSNQQKPVCRCAACYLTWLSGSSSAHYCTQTHSPVMIHCLAAYGIKLEPAGKTAARCSWRKFLTYTLLVEIPGWLLFLEGDWRGKCLACFYLVLLCFLILLLFWSRSKNLHWQWTQYDDGLESL